MALIDCPECGRKNVSDTAVCCPDCGFAIKEYYDRIKSEEMRIAKEMTLRAQKEAEKKKMRESAGERQAETVARLEKQIDNLNRTIKNSIIVLCLSLFLAVLSLAAGLGVLLVGSLFAVFGSLVFLISSTSEKNTALDDLETVMRDYEEYNEKIEQRKKAIAAQGQIYQAQNAAKHPKCPLCGSVNTERISTFDRAVSVSAVGLASSKIGKQYQCKNCKHKW